MVTILFHVCLAHPLRCCKKKTNTNKPRQARYEARRKTKKTTMYPPPSLPLENRPQTCCPIAMEPPATSSLADVAVRGLRRSVWLMAQFTIRTTRHGAPLRRALRVCSSTYLYPRFCVASVRCVRVCGCMSDLHYCGAPRCPTCAIAVAPSIVQGLQYLLRALSVSRDFTCTIPGTCTTQPGPAL